MTMREWRFWEYDVWGNAREGFEVNDRFEIDNVYIDETIIADRKKLATLVRKVFGLKKIQLSFDGDDRVIYIEASRDGYPIGEMELVQE